MIIRAATTTDAANLHRLIGEIYASTSFMCDEFDSRYPSSEELARELASEPFFVAARPDGALVGYLTLQRRGCSKLAHTADLSMGVIPKEAGKGVGRQLVDHALALASAEHGLEIVYLQVRADNTAGVRLYERAGFELLARLTRDIKVGGRHHDGLLMRKFLA